MLCKRIGAYIYGSLPKSYTVAFGVTKGNVIRKLRMAEHGSTCSVRRPFRRESSVWRNTDPHAVFVGLSVDRPRSQVLVVLVVLILLFCAEPFSYARALLKAELGSQ